MLQSGQVPQLWWDVQTQAYRVASLLPGLVDSFASHWRGLFDLGHDDLEQLDADAFGAGHLDRGLTPLFHRRVAGFAVGRGVPDGADNYPSRLRSTPIISARNPCWARNVAVVSRMNAISGSIASGRAVTSLMRPKVPACAGATRS